MRSLHLVPDTWPDGRPCRRPGCARAAVPPHGHCLDDELEHTTQLALRAGRLARLAAEAERRAPELYAELDATDRGRALAHIAAHAEQAGGEISGRVVLAGLEDFLQETREWGSRR